MDSDVIALLGGLLFLLLALVGGGFSIKEISMPKIPAMARAACLVVGVVLVLLAFVPSLRDDPTQLADDDVAAEPASTNGSLDTTAGSTGSPSVDAGAVVLWEDPDPSVAENDGIEVSGLRATGDQEPPNVDDQIEIEYTLRNVGSNPVTFNFTFTGVRGPGDRWADTGEDNNGATVQPGEALSISHPILLDAAGAWMIWPCYQVRTADGSPSECPDEWNRFFVTVG